MIESDEQREKREWRWEVWPLVCVMTLIAVVMIWRGWDKVYLFDAEAFSYLSDVTTILLNLSGLYALIRGRSIIRWVLRQWAKLVATSPRIRAMLLSLWPRPSSGMETAAAGAREDDSEQDIDSAPISGSAESPSELKPKEAKQEEQEDTFHETQRRKKRRVRLGFILSAIVGLIVLGVVFAPLVREAITRLGDGERVQEESEVPDEVEGVEETQDYLVPFRTPRVSCRLIARSFAPSRNEGDYVHIVRVNDLTNDCPIAYGTTIKLPAAWDTSQPLGGSAN